MPLDRKEVLTACEILSQQQNLQATVVESAKGAAIIGGSAFVGSIFGGPVGMGVGGVLGSLFSAYNSQGKFKSVVDIIQNDMTPAQRNKLADSLIKALQGIRPEELLLFSTAVLAKGTLQQLVLTEFIKIMKNEFGYSIQG